MVVLHLQFVSIQHGRLVSERCRYSLISSDSRKVCGRCKKRQNGTGLKNGPFNFCRVPKGGVFKGGGVTGEP